MLPPNCPTRYVLFDEDMGTDDAWALIMLLKAEQTHNIKVLAITCVSGNTAVQNVTSNTIRVLELLNRTDVPVYKGATEPLIECGPPGDFPFHGVDGFADLKYPTEPDMSLVKTENAIVAMHRIVTENPKQVTLICTGPLTNVALALKTYPDFASNIKDIYIMGGNYTAVGNTRARCSEFNFFLDTEAAYIVLLSLSCPITILPWDACVTHSQRTSMKWRIDVLGTVNHPFVEFMNPIEDAIFFKRDYEFWDICDALLIACILRPDKMIKRCMPHHCTVELQGTHTRGQVVIDHLRTSAPNVNMIEQIDDKAFKEMLLWSVDGVDIDFDWAKYML